MFNPFDARGAEMSKMLNGAAEVGRQDMERAAKLAEELIKQGK